MDGGHKSERKFPSFTLAQLEYALANEKYLPDGKTRQLMIDEIAARKAGKSKAFVVPQVLS